MDIEKFCDDGAFREKRKPRMIIRNVYESLTGQKIGRYHTFYQDGSYWLKNSDTIVPLELLNGKRSGSYCPKNPEDIQKLGHC